MTHFLIALHCILVFSQSLIGLSSASVFQNIVVLGKYSLILKAYITTEIVLVFGIVKILKEKQDRHVK